MLDELNSLPEVVDVDWSFPTASKLPKLNSHFYVPRLEDKPQNPIIARLQDLEHHRDTFPTQDVVEELVVDNEEIVREDDKERDSDVWLQSLATLGNPNYRLSSWDTLRRTCSDNPISPFLSEQPSFVVTAARQLSSHRHPVKPYIYVSPDELSTNLASTLLGLSSTLHEWDPEIARFDGVKVQGTASVAVMDGLDEQTCESNISRFLNIGSLLRRLESFAQPLQESLDDSNPTIFAFSRALHSVLDYLKREIVERSSACQSSLSLVSLWTSLEDVELALSAMASLCSVETNVSPTQYKEKEKRPTRLLSTIYEIIHESTEKSSSHLTIGILAYILTTTSRPYFRELVAYIGLDGMETALRNMRVKMQRNSESPEGIVFGEDDSSTDSGPDLESDFLEVPDFFPQEITEAVVQARRALKILSECEKHTPDSLHLSSQMLGWYWTEEEVGSILLGVDRSKSPLSRRDLFSSVVPDGKQRNFKPDLSDLKIYSLEPNAHGKLGSSRSSSELDTFLRSFPAEFPSITPTMPLLTRAIFTPVLSHARVLNKASLRIFMTPSTILHFRAHLVFLRSYLLLTSHAFKSRLSLALFSDSTSDERSLRSTTRHPPKQSDKSRLSAIWPVGLAFELIGREVWPPVGSDLAFILRRVIMDSVEPVREYEHHIGTDEFWDDAEARLGFAIRDLPAEAGKAKWMDPTLIEALDFLYMNYKVPGPLQCLITPDVLSKYQRIFTFLLRLLRVENVMRLVFRLLRDPEHPLLSSTPTIRSVVSHFRFCGQSFLSVLSSYIYDTAIGGNFDAFVAIVAAAEKEEDFSVPGKFSDIYSLMKFHSEVMDNILSACLLRSSQHSTGDKLRGCLDTLIEFGVLVGNVTRHSVSVKDAAPRLQVLHSEFGKQMDLLMKVLQTLTSNTLAHVNNVDVSSRVLQANGTLRNSPGGEEAIGDLFVRLGANNWWEIYTCCSLVVC